MTLKQRERRLVPARAGEVKAAVLGVVQQADVPLRLREIHARCEEAVGRRISYETVKDCVHKQARKSDSRLARVGHGVYWHP